MSWGCRHGPFCLMGAVVNAGWFMVTIGNDNGYGGHGPAWLNQVSFLAWQLGASILGVSSAHGRTPTDIRSTSMMELQSSLVLSVILTRAIRSIVNPNIKIDQQNINTPKKKISRPFLRRFNAPVHFIPCPVSICRPVKADAGFCSTPNNSRLQDLARPGSYAMLIDHVEKKVFKRLA